MAVQLEASRLLVLKAARLLDEGKSARLEGAMAKLFATEAAFDVAHQALQIHGGIGYTRDLPIERYFRDAKAIAHDVKLPSQFAYLVPKIKQFLEERAFGERVNLDD